MMKNFHINIFALFSLMLLSSSVADTQEWTWVRNDLIGGAWITNGGTAKLSFDKGRKISGALFAENGSDPVYSLSGKSEKETSLCKRHAVCFITIDCRVTTANSDFGNSIFHGRYYFRKLNRMDGSDAAIDSSETIFLFDGINSLSLVRISNRH